MTQGNRHRPVFHKELGQLLEAARLARRWSVHQAVLVANNKHGAHLTDNILNWLEKGKTQHPEREALQAVAALYELDYSELASSYVSANYGLGLSIDTSESAHARRYGSISGTITVQVKKLQARVAQFERLIPKLHHVVQQLVEADELADRDDGGKRDPKARRSQGRT